MLKTLIMMGIACLLLLIMELDFFMALPKFGAQHFGAPDDLKELVKKIPDKSHAVEYCGVAVLLAAFCGVAADLVWAILDTWQNFTDAMQVLVRFLIIFWGYKLFDIICIDWLLLTKIKLPERMYPETKGAKGYDAFGFNRKEQTIKLILFAVLSAAIAGIFALTH